MKKNFSLSEPNKAPARVLDAIKADVRRYVKRERRKPLPAGSDTWELECAVGADAAGAQPTPLAEVGKAIDDVAAAGGDSVYIAIIAKPGQRGRV